MAIREEYFCKFIIPNTARTSNRAEAPWRLVRRSWPGLEPGSELLRICHQHRIPERRETGWLFGNGIKEIWTTNPSIHGSNLNYSPFRRASRHQYSVLWDRGNKLACASRTVRRALACNRFLGQSWNTKLPGITCRHDPGSRYMTRNCLPKPCWETTRQTDGYSCAQSAHGGRQLSGQHCVMVESPSRNQRTTAEVQPRTLIILPARNLSIQRWRHLRWAVGEAR